MSIPSVLLDSWAPAYWAAAIGSVVCIAAYLVGRSFLVARPTSKTDESEAPLNPRFLLGISRDRRCAPRRKGNTVEVQLTERSDDPAIRGWVRDRSIGGLCLLVEHPVAEGAVMRVRPVKASAATPWTEITVRSCREDAGQFELGCQFHATPNWSLLLMFG
jgi:hypothetical protein